MLEEKVKQLISGLFKLPISQITNDSSPDTIDSWDSVGHMNLILALEQDFGVSFTEEEIVQMLNFEIILETLKEKIRS